MRQKTTIVTLGLSLVVAFGMAAVSFSTVAQAEIIEMEGVSPCPNHNPHHTSWSEHHGCTCDAGWEGPTCNNLSSGYWGSGGNTGSGAPGGYDSGGGGPSGGRPSGGASKNPFAKDGPGTMKFSSMRAAKQILVKKCWEVDGNPAWYRDRASGKRVAFCGFDSREDKQCHHQSDNIWFCGGATPVQSRVGNRLAQESPITEASLSGVPEPRQQGKRRPGVQRPRGKSGVPKPRLR